MPGLYPPDTNDLEELANSFDTHDTTELADLEEVPERPARPMVQVTLRLPADLVARYRRMARRTRIPSAPEAASGRNRGDPVCPAAPGSPKPCPGA